jgi:hypothetical protein
MVPPLIARRLLGIVFTALGIMGAVLCLALLMSRTLPPSLLISGKVTGLVMVCLTVVLAVFGAAVLGSEQPPRRAQ